MMSGTLSALGNYDQCMDTKVIEDDKEVFRGQYCILQIRPPLPKLKGRISYKKPLISLKGSKFEDTWFDKRIAGSYAAGFYSSPVYNGLCLPSSCSPAELNTIIKKCKTSSKLSLNLLFNLNVFVFFEIDIQYDFEADIDYCDHKVDKSFLSEQNTSRRIAL